MAHRDVTGAMADHWKAEHDKMKDRRDQLREALKEIFPIALNGAESPGHDGPCGPESSCDARCMAADIDAGCLSKARAALKATEEG